MKISHFTVHMYMYILMYTIYCIENLNNIIVYYCSSNTDSVAWKREVIGKVSNEWEIYAGFKSWKRWDDIKTLGACEPF